MSASETSTEATPGALSHISAVPAADHRLWQERRQGRHAELYSLRATVLTAIHQSWIRRDLWWAFIPAVAAALLVR